MNKTLILTAIAIIAILIINTNAYPSIEENPSIDPVWEYCQEHYPDMTYDFYLDCFTETDEYYDLYQALMDK